MFYIAKFDEDKNLLSKNYDNELSYYNQFSKSKVFKFYVNDGYTYYANYLEGRNESPYIAKSSDGTTFIKVEYNEINELSLPESFDEIVFLKDFEATDIDYSLIKDAE